MINLKVLRRSLADQAEAAGAIAELAEYAGLVGAASVVSGGALTVPAMLAASGKAVQGASTLLRLLLSSEGESGEISLTPPDRFDAVLYALAQQAYLAEVEALMGKLPDGRKLTPKNHRRLAEKIVDRVPPPDEAIVESSIVDGLVNDELFGSYSAYLQIVLEGWGIDRPKDRLDALRVRARKRFFKLLSGTRDDFLVNYLLLNQVGALHDLLAPTDQEDLPSKAWNRYLQELAAKPDQPIWGEESTGVCLRQLFVEPRWRYQHHGVTGPEPARDSADAAYLARADTLGLAAFLTALVSWRTRPSELVFIMGGPGQGKTSLMETWCAELAIAEERRLLLIPAKMLDPEASLLPQVQGILRSRGHEAVANGLGTEDDLLLVVDGFDELAQATRSSLEAFFRDAHELARDKARSRWRIVLSGRPTLFAPHDAAVPIGSHVVSLLPFETREVAAWSAKWTSSSGSAFDGVPYLQSEHAGMREMAAQPLLLYLLAKMSQSGNPVPVDVASDLAVKYEVYSRMLDWVCSRQEGKGTSEHSGAMLRAFLRIAGLATHHRGSRYLHWDDLKRALRDNDIATDDAALEARAYTTILSFAFSNVESRAWEFTHKQFGEALAAEAMCRGLLDLTEPGKRERTWRTTAQDASKAWLGTYGPASISWEVLEFAEGWLQTQDEPQLDQTWRRIADLLPILHGATVGPRIAEIAGEWGISPLRVLVNSGSAWLALSNSTWKTYRKSGRLSSAVERLPEVAAAEYRAAAFLSIAGGDRSFIGDFAQLFSDSRFGVAGNKICEPLELRPLEGGFLATMIHEVASSRGHRSAALKGFARRIGTAVSAALRRFTPPAGLLREWQRTARKVDGMGLSVDHMKLSEEALIPSAFDTKSHEVWDPRSVQHHFAQALAARSLEGFAAAGFKRDFLTELLWFVKTGGRIRDLMAFWVPGATWNQRELERAERALVSWELSDRAQLYAVRGTVTPALGAIRRSQWFGPEVSRRRFSGDLST